MAFSKRSSSSFGGKRRAPSDESAWEARETRALVRSLADVGSDAPLSFERSSERSPRDGTQGITRTSESRSRAPKRRASVEDEDGVTRSSTSRAARAVPDENGEVRSSARSKGFGKGFGRVEVADENGEVRSSRRGARPATVVTAQVESPAGSDDHTDNGTDNGPVALIPLASACLAVDHDSGNGTATPQGTAAESGGRKTKMERKPPSAVSYALWLLSRRDYSEKELRQKLAFKDHAPEAIDAALTMVQHHGLQSDARFVDVQTRQKANVAGDRKIRMQMKTKGVDETLVDEALQALPDERRRAFEAMRRFRNKTPDMKLQQKAYRFLAGRGFSFDSIKFAWAHTFGVAAVENLDDLDTVDD